MSVKIRFGVSTANPLTVDKSAKIAWQTGYINCDLFQACSMQKPVLKLAYNATIAGCNYAYIQDFNRYYFTKEPDLIPGQAMVISCDEDYLYTNMDEIKALKCNIRRQENIQNANDKFLMDNKYTKTSKIISDTRYFQGAEIFNKNVESDYCYILSVIGGIAAI